MTTLCKTPHNLTILYTTSQTIQDFTQFYTHLHNFTKIYKLNKVLHSFRTLKHSRILSQQNTQTKPQQNKLQDIQELYTTIHNYTTNLETNYTQFYLFLPKRIHNIQIFLFSRLCNKRTLKTYIIWKTKHKLVNSSKPYRIA